ncbi:MAG: phosphatidate cytidylyltransferase [Candidatus Melainabacteria bacterium]
MTTLSALWTGGNPVTQMALIIIGLLTLSTLLVEGLKRAKPSGDFQELAQRINAWWVMAGFFLLSMAIHPDAALVLFAVMSFLALKEYFTLIHTRMADHRALLWAFFAIPIQYWWIHIQWRAMVIIFIPVYLFLFIPFRLLLTGQTQGIVDAMARIQWGLMACVFCISHVAFLLITPASAMTPGGGRALVLFLVFLTELNDVAQYTFGKLLGGRLFGDHRVAPSISPKKTWEGLLGGIITTMALAPALSFLTGFPLWGSLAAGFIIGVSGFVGDLVMSAVKRDVGVKDSSQLIPGHGGMLDRIDSLTYTAPLFFHFCNYFFYRTPW